MSTRRSIYTTEGAAPDIHVFHEMTDGMVHITRESDAGEYVQETIVTPLDAIYLAEAILERRSDLAQWHVRLSQQAVE